MAPVTARLMAIVVARVMGTMSPMMTWLMVVVARIVMPMMVVVRPVHMNAYMGPSVVPMVISIGVMPVPGIGGLTHSKARCDECRQSQHRACDASHGFLAPSTR